MAPAVRSCLVIAVSLGIGLWTLPVYSDTAPLGPESRYEKDECVRCHAAQVNDVAAAGGKHRNVPCTGCHYGHPPKTKKPIAQCSKCHLQTRKAHFKVAGCLNCHNNPHTPLRITFKGQHGCLNCHGLQTGQLRNSKSKHAGLDCVACHDVHREVPECAKCHIPHAGKVVSGCKQCHKPHMPKPPDSVGKILTTDCGKCHYEPVELLGASGHKRLECAHCHQGKHKAIPTCQDCHASPHPAGIMEKFPQCGICHNIAHSLNNWTSAAIPEAVEEAPKNRH